MRIETRQPVIVRKGHGVYRYKYVATDSYRCKHHNVHCARAYFPVGTPSPQTCWRCGKESMALETYRKKAKSDPEIAKRDKGERCECNGPKSRDDEKVIYDPRGEPIVRGPHRKGQAGCQFATPNMEIDIGEEADGFTLPPEDDPF